ncbi:hypothetical protein GCM10022409_35860 [Hymenobacter glaciei]|uniref:Secretion system C-terminal sorting domain-containing protein n=1 Tax=Hymenobacter glaciei TaxID=877209 RepID=A0ABP7UNH6_9BACT
MKPNALLLALLLAGGQAALAQCVATPSFYGRSTYYTPSTGGTLNCAFPDALAPGIPTVAVSDLRYGTTPATQADLCGACVEVTGPAGKKVFMVRDRCPECAANQLDIQASALHYVGYFGTFDGKNATHFKVVACPLTAPVQFALKEGTNPYWSSVQVRNARYPIAKLEYRQSNGQYLALQRTQDNYFPLSGVGLAGRTATFRVTDNNGNAITETVKFSTITTPRQGPTVPGQHQFPNCATARAAFDPTAPLASPAHAEELVPSAHQLEVWPNPATSVVRLNWTDRNDEPMRVTIVNAQGLVVQRKDIKSLTAYALDTAELPNGVYHISLQAGSATNYAPLMVQH